MNELFWLTLLLFVIAAALRSELFFYLLYVLVGLQVLARLWLRRDGTGGAHPGRPGARFTDRLPADAVAGRARAAGRAALRHAGHLAAAVQRPSPAKRCAALSGCRRRAADRLEDHRARRRPAGA